MSDPERRFQQTEQNFNRRLGERRPTRLLCIDGDGNTSLARLVDKSHGGSTLERGTVGKCPWSRTSNKISLRRKSAITGNFGIITRSQGETIIARAAR